MRKKTIVALTLMLLFMLQVPSVISLPVRLPSTIPPISAQSAGIIFECSPFIAFPGSVTTGASGFIRIECPSSGALSLDGTLTPSFQLGLGYTQAGIVQHTSAGNPCDYRFRAITIGNVTVPSGSILNRTLTFSSNPVQGNMLTTVYDYCLQYTNASSAGLASFSIAWT